MKKGWALLPLGEVCTLEKAQGRHEGLPYVGLEHIESATGRFVGQATPVTVKSSTFRFDERHVLYGRLRPYLNKVLVPTFTGHCSTEIFPLRPKDQVLNRHFLAYWLMADRTVRALNATSTGARMPRANATQMMCFQIPVPPLADQERIVAILDDCLNRLGAASQNLQDELARTDALLASALSGEMTSDGPAWPTMTLSEMLDRGFIMDHMDGNHGSDYPRKNEFIDAGVPYLSAKCLTPEGVDFARAKHLSIERVAGLRKGFARDGDVLFAHNATVGPVAILHTEVEPVILGTSLTYYRCNPNHVLPAYLAHFMRSLTFRRQYEQVMKQSTRNQVPITMQRTFFFVVPPVAVQSRIAHVMDGLAGQVAALKRNLKTRTQLLDEMRSSLLDRAFSGGL